MDEMNKLLEKLAFCEGIGNLSRLKVLRYCLQRQIADISRDEIIQVAAIQRYRDKFCASWNESETAMEKNQRKFFTILDDEYPEQLREIYNPPCVLFYEGNLELLDTSMLAVIGSREATPYAGKVLQDLLPEIIEQKFTIVSGLAKGVDSLAHKLAITYKGKTIGILGNGIDECYPKEGYYLQKKMQEEHLVISEYPDGTKPRKYHFPMRNRIIAGLSWGTCVIEAKQRSGSLITAQMALESGREVFAVPGEVLNPYSIGCLKLIQEGAKCVISAGDILEELPNY